MGQAFNTLTDFIIFSGTVRPTETPETFLKSSITVYLSRTPGLSLNPDLLNFYYIKKNLCFTIDCGAAAECLIQIYKGKHTESVRIITTCCLAISKYCSCKYWSFLGCCSAGFCITSRTIRSTKTPERFIKSSINV